MSTACSRNSRSGRTTVAFVIRTRDMIFPCLRNGIAFSARDCSTNENAAEANGGRFCYHAPRARRGPNEHGTLAMFSGRSQQNVAEHALGAIKGKEGRVVFFNYVISVTPDCDCFDTVDMRKIVPDIGR